MKMKNRKRMSQQEKIRAHLVDFDHRPRRRVIWGGNYVCTISRN
jgi:hypothetical protein